MSTPDRIGDYEILGELGRGSMGVVYRAHKVSLPDREVALKEVTLGLGSDERARRMLEARALLKMQSLHIVGLLDVFESAERSSLLIVMERLKSETLRDRMASLGGPMEPDAAMEVIDGILDALEAAHGATDDAGRPRPIVHRDLKPENVGYQDWRGTEISKVMDFGVADIAEGGDGARTSRSSVRAFKAFTPAYIAPEVLEGREAGPAVDLFALGLMAWELLVGRHPFADARGRLPNAVVVQSRIAQEAVPDLPEHLVPRLPEGLVDLVRDMGQRDPALRPTALEARERLRRSRGQAGASTSGTSRVVARSLPPPRRGRTGPLIATAALVFLGLGAAAIWWGASTTSSEPAPTPPAPVLTVIPPAPPGPSPTPLSTPPNVDLGSDVTLVDVGEGAMAPGSYQCRLDQGTPTTCTLSLAGGSADLPAYRLRSSSGERLLDGTLTRQAGQVYGFRGQILSGLKRTPIANASGELSADPRGSQLRGTLSNAYLPGEGGPVVSNLELRR